MIVAVYSAIFWCEMNHFGPVVMHYESEHTSSRS